MIRQRLVLMMLIIKVNDYSFITVNVPPPPTFSFGASRPSNAITLFLIEINPKQKYHLLQENVQI